MADSEKKMDWKSKVAIGASIAAVIASLLYVVKVQNDILDRQEAIEKSVIEQKDVSDKITRSQSSLMTKKDLLNWAKENKIDLEPIKKDIKKLGADIEGIQTIRVYSTGYSATDLPSTSTTPNPDPKPIDPKNPDPFGYFTNKQSIKLTERVVGEEIPFGEVGFSAWKENPWAIDVKDRIYGVDTVTAVDYNGRKIPYNTMFVEVNGQRYNLKIAEAEYKEIYKKPKFHFYPRLFAGVDAGAYFTQVSGAVAPNLQIALFNYGATKPNPDWTFLGIGLGYEIVDKNFSFVLSPVSYNVGQHLPFVDNIHVRPTVIFTPTGEFSIMTGLGFGL